MIACTADESGRVLAMSYFHHVDVAEVKRCLGTVRDLINQLQPGFVLLTDLSGLVSMEPDCAPDLGEIMDLCNERGMSTVIRVIPDPTKDIGFGLISKFHLSTTTHVQTHEGLAQAIAALLEEELPGKLGENPSPQELERLAEDNQAEAHFTTEARKEAEVNEGGLVEDLAPSGCR